MNSSYVGRSNEYGGRSKLEAYETYTGRGNESSAGTSIALLLISALELPIVPFELRAVAFLPLRPPALQRPPQATAPAAAALRTAPVAVELLTAAEAAEAPPTVAAALTVAAITNSQFGTESNINQTEEARITSGPLLFYEPKLSLSFPS